MFACFWLPPDEGQVMSRISLIYVRWHIQRWDLVYLLNNQRSHYMIRDARFHAGIILLDVSDMNRFNSFNKGPLQFPEISLLWLLFPTPTSVTNYNLADFWVPSPYRKHRWPAPVTLGWLWGRDQRFHVAFILRMCKKERRRPTGRLHSYRLPLFSLLICHSATCALQQFVVPVFRVRVGVGCAFPVPYDSLLRSRDWFKHSVLFR